MNPVRPWYYTYVLRSRKTYNFYTGTTYSLKRRLEEHNTNKVLSTKNRGPFELIYFEAYLSKDDAFRRERYLKTGMGKRDLRKRIKGGLTG